MSDSAFILIVEDEPQHAEALADGLRGEGHLCRVVQSGQEALESIHAQPPDVIVTDQMLVARYNGGSLLSEARRLAPDAEIIVMAPAAEDRAIEKRSSYAGDIRVFEYVARATDAEKIRRVVDDAARLAQRNRHRRAMQEQADRRIEFEGIITVSEKMARVLKMLRKAAESKLTVLILGESGTGKELAARAVHRHSPRSQKPYYAVNCAGFNENLLESELFGHVKGAFTGAVNERKGMFEAVDGGTIFLDEVGDMPQPMQAKLLRTLENGEVVPVGSNEVRKVDVRVIAATRQDLRSMVEGSTFRDDLFYRLNQAVIRMPPLRERREDIPLLINHFLSEACDVHDKEVDSIVPDAVRKLTAYNWPGNVRELRSVIDAMVVYAESPQIGLEDLPEHIRGATELAVASAPTTAGLTMDQVERLHIANTLKLTNGNREKAAKMLGIGARTLYRKLREYGL